MNRSDSAPLKNAMLPKGDSRWRSFCAGAIVQALLLCFMVLLCLLFPERVYQLGHYVAMQIAPTSPVVSAEQPVRRRPRRIRVQTVKTTELPVATPQIPPPVASVAALRPVSLATAPQAPKLAVDATPSNLIAESAVPHLQKPQEPVRVGGFGNPSGLRAPSTSFRPNAPQVGSFDRPSNSDRGARRTRGAPVREGAFGSGERGVGDPLVKPMEPSSRSKPLQILFKPTPEYTKVALAKKVQGNVVLEVLFSASGEVQVLRVLKGLGYGLDQTAIEAASEIKFRPAQNQAGEPIDSTARVRIAFELAY